MKVKALRSEVEEWASRLARAIDASERLGGRAARRNRLAVAIREVDEALEVSEGPTIEVERGLRTRVAVLS